MFTKILWICLSVLTLIIPFDVEAQTIDDFLNQLKDSSPELRAKAAWELGAG